MPEKDFEKQVQDKMEELRLRPGEPVWEKIEKTLRKDKRRRAFFILPLLAGLLLLGYTGYRLIIHTDKQKNVATNNGPSTEKKNTKPVKTIHDSILHQDDEAITKKETVPVIADPEMEREKTNVTPDSKETVLLRKVLATNQQRGNEPITNEPHINTRNTDKKKLRPAANKPVQNQEQEQEQEQADLSIDRPSVQQPVANNDQAATTTKPDSVSASTSNTVTASTPNTVRTPDTLSVTNPDTIANVTADSAVVKSPVVKETDQKKEGRQNVAGRASHRSSRFAIQATVGISDIRSNPLSFSRSAPAITNYYSAGVINAYPQGPAYPTFLPSEIKAGNEFSIGLDWERSISKRSALSTGLHYVYFSNEIMVGTKTMLQLQLAYDALNDKTLDEYYGGAQTKKFINHYHFLELPLEYHYQFNIKKKIGIEMTTGLVLDWLISSNELMYDTIRGGVYFHSKDLFNKAQLGFNGSVSLRFRLKNNASFLIGPKAFLDLSRMTKDGFDRNRYLIAGSLQARYVFPGKTKNNATID